MDPFAQLFGDKGNASGNVSGAASITSNIFGMFAPHGKKEVDEKKAGQKEVEFETYPPSPLSRSSDVRSIGDSEARARKRPSMPLDEDGHAYVPSHRPLVRHEEEKETPSSASTAQPEKLRTPYAIFMDKIREPAAKPLVEQITAFLNTFAAKGAINGRHEMLHDFLSRTHREYGTLYDDYFEGLEKLVVNGLYPLVFAKDLQDQAEDRRLRSLITSLSWVDYSHLEIPPKDPRLLDLAVSELRRMDVYKSPRDKLICILNACRVIGNVLQNEEANTTGADDFLPLLIYCLLRANPPNLKSNLAYVENYRHPSRMHGEEAYFFMTLLSAMTFVSQITWESLDISEEEYSQLVQSHAPSEDDKASSIDEGEKESEDEDEDIERDNDADEKLLDTPKTNVQKALAAIDANKVMQLYGSLTFKYEAATSPFNLRLREVGELLDEYHRMSRFLKRMQFHLERQSNR